MIDASRSEQPHHRPAHREPLHIEAVEEGRGVRLVLNGELTYATVHAFMTQIEHVLDPFHPQLVLEVDRLHFCDSVGLSALLHAQRRARSLGGVVVLSGVHGRLQRVLSVTGTGVLFSVVGALDTAESCAAGERGAGETA